MSLDSFFFLLGIQAEQYTESLGLRWEFVIPVYVVWGNLENTTILL